MPWRFERRDADAAEIDGVLILHGDMRVLRRCLGAKTDDRPRAIAQLQVSGEEVGVQVRQEDMRDPQLVLAREGEILLDIALRVHHDRLVGVFVAHEVRGVREAIEVELFEDHGIAPLHLQVTQSSGPGLWDEAHIRPRRAPAFRIDLLGLFV